MRLWAWGQSDPGRKRERNEDAYLVDPETGRQLRVDTRSRRLRERFAVAAAAERAEIARSLSSVGVRHVVLTTSGDWLRPLVTFLRRSRS